MARTSRFNPQTTLSDIPGLYARNRLRLGPGTLPKWQAARAKVIAGVADAKLLCEGDSTTYGSSSTVPFRDSYPARLALLLNSSAMPAARGLSLPPHSAALASDTRWTAGDGWPESRNFGFANNSAWRAVAPAGDLVFADPTVMADSFDFYYRSQSGDGTFTLTATGSAPVVQTASASGAVRKLTVTAAVAATTNSLTIQASGAEVYVIAVEPFLSTTKTIRVGNAGIPSSSTIGHVSSGLYNSRNCLTAYAPDLTILSLGINDSSDTIVQDDAWAASTLSNITTIAGTASATGDVIIMTPLPSQNAIQAGNEGRIAELMKQLNYPVLDLFGRMSPWTSTESYMADDRHATAKGNAHIAQWVHAALI